MEEHLGKHDSQYHGANNENNETNKSDLEELISNGMESSVDSSQNYSAFSLQYSCCKISL